LLLPLFLLRFHLLHRRRLHRQHPMNRYNGFHRHRLQRLK
jgi:hypothetical protein